MAQATTAILKGRRRVKVARERFATPEEVEADRKRIADRHPAAVMQRVLDSVDAWKQSDNADSSSAVFITAKATGIVGDAP
jgi:hypothetical protein